MSVVALSLSQGIRASVRPQIGAFAVAQFFSTRSEPLSDKEDSRQRIAQDQEAENEKTKTLALLRTRQGYWKLRKEFGPSGAKKVLEGGPDVEIVVQRHSRHRLEVSLAVATYVVLIVSPYTTVCPVLK
jgi:hypothetical protein